MRRAKAAGSVWEELARREAKPKCYREPCKVCVGTGHMRADQRPCGSCSGRGWHYAGGAAIRPTWFMEPATIVGRHKSWE